MPREARLYTNSEVYHIIMRGNNKQNLFYTKKDRYFFINRLKKYAAELKIEIYAYCLMSNHVHILIGKANSGLSKYVQKIANSYVYYFNKKYDRCGHLFQGRFKSEPIDSKEYFKTVFRYILKNPEKAGLSKFDTYKWSSYKNYIKNDCKSQISLDLIVDIFGNLKYLKNYLSENTHDLCMEYENKFRINDIQATKIIKKIFDVSNLSLINQLSLNEQIKKVKKLKMYGLPCNQIIRITGISRAIISIS